MAGIAASSGSACTSGATEPSHVVAALGLPDDWVRGTLRLSFGAANDLGDVEAVATVLPSAVARLRALAPRRRDAGSATPPITGAVEGYPATVKPAHG